ncbi:hypothetical protein B0H14DRAFT_3515037 [Mycena olivaceomarginata]|nr:hypothetical protein B0H14DRAFT_3515037 [Mycena olivaceomarginata]
MVSARAQAVRKCGCPKKVVQPEVPAVQILQEEKEETEADELNNDSSTVAAEAAPFVDNALIDWSDELVWTLISAIESDTNIYDGLFPGVGAIKRSGRTPKTHHYYNLASTMKFKQRKLWTEKVGNKIKVLIKKARDNILEMGQTGAGLDSADDIEPESALATKWDLIEEESPWFFNMRALIAARPNLQPVGLGNNDTGFETDLLLRLHSDDDVSSALADGDTQDLPSQLSDLDYRQDINSDDSDEKLVAGPTLAGAKRPREVEKVEKGKGKAGPEPPVKKPKTGPQKGTSLPAASAPVVVPAKKMSTKDRFTATVLAEEETVQGQLKMKREKYSSQKEVALAKIEAEKEVQLEKVWMKREEKAAKSERKHLQMDREYQLRLAQIQSQAGSSSMSFLGTGVGGSSHGDSTFMGFDGLPRFPDTDFGAPLMFGNGQ